MDRVKLLTDCMKWWATAPSTATQVLGQLEDF